ncbi:MAG: hypothetical protein KIT84_15510 [Labilithrix sp.]|nr:hypothetical protein [Labilithrix sp.]MCW5812433.1 hypothetical protein [Labilithrix sp.]
MTIDRGAFTVESSTGWTTTSRGSGSISADAWHHIKITFDFGAAGGSYAKISLDDDLPIQFSFNGDDGQPTLTLGYFEGSNYRIDYDELIIN